MQLQVGVLCQEAPGMILMADDGLLRNISRASIGIVCDAAYCHATAVKDRVSWCY